ncbi:glycosyltransferase family 2 protein [Achromobacter sp. F4_2707]|uniref:glycosyltransferase family 2 protein n=1 Tax=Achromobacter sp. F4_2707 TaxID=3114286 RepID=UPI0039C6FDB5
MEQHTDVFSPPYPLDTAVLFLVFNRPEPTKQVFEAIRLAKPPRLYIAADGPRESRKGEADKVQHVRELILSMIDWDCEVKTLFRDSNLGCKMAVSSAITWFFENEEQGIILEDDCLPSQSFFWFCEELLNKYVDNEAIFLISGDARGPESFGMKEDYGFCKYPLIWGWASWSRVWKNYDVEMQDWPKQKNVLPPLISNNKPTIKFWKKTFDKVYRKNIDTWDYQFTYLLQKKKGKCIVPKVNLITNIGFGADATHTFSQNSIAANRTRHEINLPLNHTQNAKSEIEINNFFDNNVFLTRSLIVRVTNRISRMVIGKTIFK